ncbi:MAG: hypothetical protein ACYDBB_03925 [Armatimonadota bacterium]
MSLFAGVGVRDVSPLTPMFLVGYPHVPRISTGVHDPLLASALCLRGEGGAVMLVGVDILFLSPATATDIRRRISHETGIAEEAVFVSCTHTHSGPVTIDYITFRDDPCVPPTDPVYVEYLAGNIVAAACDAAATPHTAEIAWTTADGRGVGGNRLSPDGVTDPEVGVLAVREQGNGRWLALDVTYGMHPTVMHEDSTLVSADFPGFTRQHLREALDPELVVVYHNAPCGNQSPRNAVKAQTFAEAERLGRMLGERILTRVQQIDGQDFTTEAKLDGVLDSITPTPRAMPAVADAKRLLQEQVATFERLQREGAGHGPVRTAECAVFGAEESLILARAQASGELSQIHKAYSKAVVQAVRIGHGVMVGLPAEIFVEYSLEIKRRADNTVFVVSLANGELGGYIVTPEAAAAGGYEAANSLFTPETGSLLVDKAVELAQKLLERETV